MSKSAKREKQDGILPVFFWIFLTATLLVLFILTMTLLDRNGTIARVKEQFAEWREEREAAKRAKNAGEKSVTYFGPSGIAEYDSWFSGGTWGDVDIENMPPDGQDVTIRQDITVSPVNGSESWWGKAKKLNGNVTLYAQAETPLYGSPDKVGKVFGYTAAGEAFRLFAVFEDGWYVVTDGRFYYCSEGNRYTMVQPETVDFEAVFAAREEKKVVHTIKGVLQNPELPHGCEVTALTVLLSYYGCSADKCVLADEWLPKGTWGSTDFNKAFVGNPRKSVSSAGCFASVIEDTANRYLQAQGSSLIAKSCRDVSFEELLSMVEEAPVIAWMTMELKAPYIAQVWTVDGEELYWQNYEHCTVLSGYDLEKGVFYGADPLYGACEYDMKLFFLRFQTMYSQVVRIENGTGY
ncbi:MAG: C39 family peptidase [Lachnospiraceae bacterium]|nr:C39 family peptidase [Lachnospiraceae bacterium]